MKRRNVLEFLKGLFTAGVIAMFIIATLGIKTWFMFAVGVALTLAVGIIWIIIVWLSRRSR